METLLFRRKHYNVFKVLKKKKKLPKRIFCFVKLAFKIEGEVKSFPDKQMVNEFIITYELDLKEILKGIL